MHSISDQPFGQVAGQAVRALTMTNAHGLRATVISYGARLTELHVPDSDGRFADIVLGHDRIENYVTGTGCFGATCGRYANRIGGGSIVLDGVRYPLPSNEGANHLHGGPGGFDTKVWDAAVDGNRVVFTATSADGEMGHPGACALRCTYALTDDNQLLITMEAETTKTTVMNMANHAYFNLAGHGAGPVYAQKLQIAAGHYTPVGADMLPTGEVLSVAKTPFDFRVAKPFGQDIAALTATRGYDHNWCLTGGGGGLHDCLMAHDPGSGRRLALRTTEPGVQIYTGGFIAAGTPGKGGVVYGPHAGFAIETQKFPNSPNTAHFPSAVLRPGQQYCHQMEYTFSV